MPRYNCTAFLESVSRTKFHRWGLTPNLLKDFVGVTTW